MSSVDRIMIPVTIIITFIAIIPFIAPVGLFENFTITTTQDVTQQPTPSQKNDNVYFQGFDDNIEEAKQSVRDLLAEHEAANP